MKVPNKVLNIVVRLCESPNPNITPATDEEKGEVLAWATAGITKRKADALKPKPEQEA